MLGKNVSGANGEKAPCEMVVGLLSDEKGKVLYGREESGYYLLVPFFKQVRFYANFEEY